MNPPTYTLEQAEELRRNGDADIIDYGGERQMFLVTREAVYRRTNSHYEFFGDVKVPVHIPKPRFLPVREGFHPVDLSSEWGCP